MHVLREGLALDLIHGRIALRAEEWVQGKQAKRGMVHGKRSLPNLN
jgi:hypothetical protein